MILWHVGATTLFIRYAFRDQNMDLRFLALGAILPDIIDTPIGIVMWSSWQTPRLWSHAILFGAVLLTAVLLITRRGTRRKQWMLLTVGVLMHLALDGMWSMPETLWWPFLGSDFTPTEFPTYAAYVGDLLRSPVVWLGEAAGLAYLVYLWKRSGLGGREARAALISTGRISAPIERG